MTEFKTTRKIIRELEDMNNIWFDENNFNMQWISKEDHEKEIQKIEDRILDRMIMMEQASMRHPNLMQTYKVMWEGLKRELKGD